MTEEVLYSTCMMMASIVSLFPIPKSPSACCVNFLKSRQVRPLQKKRPAISPSGSLTKQRIILTFSTHGSNRRRETCTTFFTETRPSCHEHSHAPDVLEREEPVVGLGHEGLVPPGGRNVLKREHQRVTCEDDLKRTKPITSCLHRITVGSGPRSILKMSPYRARSFYTGGITNIVQYCAIVVCTGTLYGLIL